MNVEIRWDDDWERKVMAAASDQVNAIGEKAQRLFDSMASYKGQAAPTIAEELRKRADEHGLSFSSEQVNGYAEALGEGRRIVIEVEEQG